MRLAWLGFVARRRLRAAPVAAGTVQGKVAVLEKDGKPAQDTDEAVVWVEGPKVRPRPTGATVTMKDKAFVPRVSGGERRRQGGVPEPGPDLPQRLLGVGREPLRPRALQEAEERLQGLRAARASSASTATSTRR